MAIAAASLVLGNRLTKAPDVRYTDFPPVSVCGVEVSVELEG